MKTNPAPLPPDIDKAIAPLSTAVHSRTQLNGDKRIGIKDAQAEAELLVFYKGRALLEAFEIANYTSTLDASVVGAVLTALEAAEACFTIDTASKAEVRERISAIEAAREKELVAV